MNELLYPLGKYAEEQPLWIRFYATFYSTKNVQRTREWVQSQAFAKIRLPLPSDVGYAAAHEFGQGWTPIAAISKFKPNLANNGGQISPEREFGSATFLKELQNPTTSTFRKFSNITELTMVSEARKKYEFKYIFAPKNEAESVAVENICGTFKKLSYPTRVDGMPERTYPQNLWSMKIIPGNNSANEDVNYTADWLGDPLVCVLTSITVKKNDKADPVIRLLPNGYSNITLLSLAFEEFETGTWDPFYGDGAGAIRSKSEISADEFPNP